MAANRIELGRKVRDRVSKFEGVALARMTSVHEANQIRVHADQLDADGNVRAGVWFEETRLEALEEPLNVAGFVVKTINGKLVRNET